MKQPKSQIVQKLIDTGAIAIIRMPDSEKLKRIAEGIYKGGLTAIEITMTTPNALKVIEELAKSMGTVIQVGVGSVLDSETTRMAINAGATYVVSPVYKKAIIDTAHQYGCPAIPGAFSPTEIMAAYEQGADLVKVYPANLLGMDYINDIKAPMPQLELMPSGGVTPENAGDWIKAGASCVGVGSALLDKHAIAVNHFEKITNLAKQLKESIEQGKAA